jgi:acetoin utilization deacetylase AcuC-like enzyme
VFNDIAVASAVSLRDYPHLCNTQSPILIIDLDVHQVSQAALYSLHNPPHQLTCDSSYQKIREVHSIVFSLFFQLFLQEKG